MSDGYRISAREDEKVLKTGGDDKSNNVNIVNATQLFT